MKPDDYFREVALPLTTPSVLFSLILFFFFFKVASIGFMFGLVIGLVLASQIVAFVLPALLRTLLQVLDARSKGKEPDPPVIEFLSWVGNMWALIPIVHIAFFVYAFYMIDKLFGDTSAYTLAAAYALFLPASLIVLVLTHSVVESFRPVAILALVRRCGVNYLIAPLFLIASAWSVYWLFLNTDLRLLTEFAGFYLTFASFALFGGLVRPLKLHRELDIPEATSVVEDELHEQQSLVRTAALNHAYGLISRGNRDSGLEYLYEELARDEDSASAWFWYFDHMMRWERNDSGLAFAQQYLHQLLREGENVAAVKIMLRCRLVNTAFKPLAEDMPMAIYAAEQCHNEELANFLR
ncbi:MAG: hypothetical protein ACR2QT_13700 [Woeseiaceae bacterium]